MSNTNINLPKSPFWFFLEQYVYTEIIDNNILIYNELNSVHEEFINITDKYLLNVITRLKNSQDAESRIITINQEEACSVAVIDFIAKIRASFSGDVIEQATSVKPLTIEPTLYITDDVEYMQIDENYLLNYNIKLSVNEITINTGCVDVNEIISMYPFKTQFNYQKQRYDIYNYLDKILSEIPAYKHLQRINIIYYEDSLLGEIYSFIKSVKNTPIYIHTQIKNAEEIVSILGDKCYYCIYVDSRTYNYELLANFANSTNIKLIMQVCSYIEIDMAHSCALFAQLDIIPVIKSDNLSFCKDLLSLSKDDIFAQGYSLKEILINKVINKNSFGKIFIDEHGQISALGTSVKNEFNIKNDHIINFVYDQLKYKKDWFVLRSHLQPCKTCIFRNLCPPVSFYEIVLEQYNLCNITQQ